MHKACKGNIQHDKTSIQALQGLTVNIIVEVNGKEMVFPLRFAKILYNKLGEALHGKELEVKHGEKKDAIQPLD